MNVCLKIGLAASDVKSVNSPTTDDHQIFSDTEGKVAEA